MKFPDCRPLALLLLPAWLTACGGSPPVNDVANAMANALVCTLRNCTESTTLRTDELSLRFSATQRSGEGNLTVSGFVGKSANVTTTVLLQPSETLSASVDGGPETPLRNIDGQRLDYEASLPAGSAQPVVQLVLTRDGMRNVSSVVMPVAFNVAAPTGTPTLARSAGSLAVTLAPAPSNPVGATMQGNCTRKDGSSFDVRARSSLTVQPGPAAGDFRIDTLPLDKSLNDIGLAANNNAVGTSLVSRCQLTLTWAASATGTAAATLNKYSSFTASREASHSIAYDAWL